MKKIIRNGIPINSKIVLIIVRDSKYLEKEFKYADFSYHSYRDCNIENFKLVAEYLTTKGYFVIRMGTEVKIN